MDELIDILKNYNLNDILVLFVLFALAIYGIVEMVKKVKGMFDSYHKNQSAKEDKEKNITDRLDKLEEGEKETTETLGKISESIDELRKLIETVQRNQNKSNLATCKSALYRLSAELISKGWVSQIEYETLQDLYDVYKMSSPNPIYDGQNNNIRRALMLPILTEEEIEAKIYEDAMHDKYDYDNQ